MSPELVQGNCEIGNFEIEQFLHLKSEIRNFKSDWQQGEVRSENLDFGFEMQELFDFEISDFTIPLANSYRDGPDASTFRHRNHPSRDRARPLYRGTDFP